MAKHKRISNDDKKLYEGWHERLTADAAKMEVAQSIIETVEESQATIKAEMKERGIEVDED